MSKEAYWILHKASFAIIKLWLDVFLTHLNWVLETYDVVFIQAMMMTTPRVSRPSSYASGFRVGPSPWSRVK
jgi:hypothetical protein